MRSIQCKIKCEYPTGCFINRKNEKLTKNAIDFIFLWIVDGNVVSKQSIDLHSLAYVNDKCKHMSNETILFRSKKNLLILLSPAGFCLKCFDLTQYNLFFSRCFSVPLPTNLIVTPKNNTKASFFFNFLVRMDIIHSCINAIKHRKEFTELNKLNSDYLFGKEMNLSQ